MHKPIKKYFSLFFLFLFLFPLVEKEVHALQHNMDVHCTASDIHLHQLEHHCAICDFTVTDSNTPASSSYQLIIAVSQLAFKPFIASIYIPDAFQDLPSRAPPVNA